MKRLAVLVGVTAAAWVLLALPAGLWLEGTPLIVTAAAALVCLVPAALTLALADRLADRPPEEKVVVALVSTVLRIGLAIGGGVLLYFRVSAVRENAAGFVGWGVGFYLVTLAVETGLLYRAAVAGPTRPDAPSQ